jgi:hypothetical protein
VRLQKSGIPPQGGIPVLMRLKQGLKKRGKFTGGRKYIPHTAAMDMLWF